MQTDFETNPMCSNPKKIEIFFGINYGESIVIPFNYILHTLRIFQAACHEPVLVRTTDGKAMKSYFSSVSSNQLFKGMEHDGT